jgi:hypothetical protein
MRIKSKTTLKFYLSTYSTYSRRWAQLTRIVVEGKDRAAAPPQRKRLDFSRTLLAAWNRKVKDLMEEVWASHFRRIFPGVGRGNYVRPSMARGDIAAAWTRATAGAIFTPSQHRRACLPPDAPRTKSPFAVPSNKT